MKHPLLLRAATVGIITLGMASLGAQAASADDSAPEAPQSVAGPAPAAPAADATPYKLLAWMLPCGVDDRFCAPGQQLEHVLDLAEPDLDALDGLVVGTCSDWQIDLDYDSPTTAALIAAGVLVGPNTPLEDHAYGALGEGVEPYKVVDNPDCAVAGSVVPIAVATDQSCDAAMRLLDGTIEVAVMSGVTYTITGPQGTVAFDPTSGLSDPVAPGTYSVAFALDPTVTTPVVGPISVTVAPVPVACTVPVITPPTTGVISVTPVVDPTSTSLTAAGPAGCSVGTTGTTPAACELTTLALTGSSPVAPALLASSLLLLGTLALVLSARHRRFARTETEHQL